jgi:hypothetical protein
MHWIAILLVSAVTACAQNIEQRENPGVELAGTVVERTLTRSANGALRQIATLETADGRRVAVDFGPPGGEATIAKGERVKVTGHRGVHDGNPVVVAAVVVRMPGAAPAASSGQ